MKQYRGKIFIDPESRNDPMTERVLKKLPHLPKRIITLEELLSMEKGAGISKSKQQLFLTRDKGNQLKRCPGTQNRICCNYFVINQGIGCPFDCSYCFLQDFSNLPAIFLYTNVNDLLEEVRSHCLAHRDRFFRIGTGEMSDSLALDHLTEFSRDIIPLFSTTPNALLELKTKSCRIENLLELDPQGKTVVSWSLNPEQLINSDESGTASLEERLHAATRVQNAGYRLAFHFDPVVLFPDWEQAYREVVSRLVASVDTKSISWISLGTFRYRKPMKEIMDSRFPESRLTAGEHLAGNDGKMRYFLPLRVEAYRKITAMLLEHDPDIFLYLCMEDSNVWEAVFRNKQRLKNMPDLDQRFLDAIRNNFP